ncbi:MAG: DUF3500 domain-containing protein [Candidatus Sulfopaludibacter sp.]|nr:DUF3500 domain-containing protein [Candidatus Sulfopaludibacter sp.]
MINRWKRLLVAGCAVALLAFAYETTSSPGIMTGAARAYLNSLSPELRARTSFPMDPEERTNWHFVPLDRKGVALREMTSAQKHLAEALLSAGLSQQGIIKAHTIMSLDQVLKDMEKGTGPERDPEKYYVSIFGEPSESGTWGYRFEGHHISLNFTIVNGHIASSPSFFGDNPALVKEGPRAGLRALMREEDLGRALVKSLDDSQRSIAIVEKTAPKDIITFDSRKAALNGQPSGLPFSKMNAKQKEAMTALISEYANNFPPQIADFRLDQYRKNQASLFFAWAGGVEPGQPHYYRVQTPAFLIEYDDTQNNANHIHSVWRDFNGDFGMDLLAMHYQASHQK